METDIIVARPADAPPPLCFFCQQRPKMHKTKPDGSRLYLILCAECASGGIA